LWLSAGWRALQEDQPELYRPALESLRSLIRTATSSMTSVPKPLKFLRPFYPELQGLYDGFPARLQDQATENLFADILSVLAMTYSDTGKRDTLHYKLKTAGKGDEEDPGSWGHEYVRHLAAELGEEFSARQDAYAQEADSDEPLKVPQELLDLALRLVPFFMNHNGEPDAVDLLLELENIEAIIPFVDENTFARVCSYMVACVNLLVPPDDRRFLQTARQIYRKHGRFTEAITLAIRLNDLEAIVEDFQTPSHA
jgi:26S proteasome regulatory subunit N1